MQSSTLTRDDAPTAPNGAPSHEAVALNESWRPGPSTTEPLPPSDLRRFDVVRYQFNGRVQTGTVIEVRSERVWLKTGAATLAVPVTAVLSLVQPSPAR